MKIFAVGMNYLQHNKELEGALYKPETPVIFTKADSALLKDGKPFFLPDFSEQVDYETELVVRICRLGKCIPERFAHRYYDAVTVGIDFTARDVQQRLRAAGHPWELSKGFDGSAAIGQWVEKELGSDPVKTGVKVIHRTDSNYDEALSQIVDSVVNVDALKPRELDKLRRAAKATSKQATWDNFMSYYTKAYELAMKNAKARNKK